MVLEAGGVTVHFGWGWGGFFVGMAVAVASRVVGGRVCGDVRGGGWKVGKGGGRVG